MLCLGKPIEVVSISLQLTVHQPIFGVLKRPLYKGNSMKPTVLLHNTRIRNRALMLVAALGLAAVPTKAMAHQVQTNYFLNGPAGDSLELQTTFSNGQPLKGAKVTVYAPDQV